MNIHRAALACAALVVLTSPLSTAATCTVRVDLQWINTLPEEIDRPVQPAAGVTLGPPEARMAADFLGTSLGPVYWRETAKKGYADICLDGEHADYFVFWNGVGGATSVFVFPKRGPSCAVAKEVFTTATFNGDPERSAKQAFKETLTFLRRNGNADYSSIPGCIAPEKIAHLSDIPTQEQEPSQPPSSKPASKAALLASDSAQSLLDISSTPPGADIELDGSFIGNTPSSISVPVGEHVVRITKSGYKQWERKINALVGKINVATELKAEAKSSQPPQR